MQIYILSGLFQAWINLENYTRSPYNFVIMKMRPSFAQQFGTERNFQIGRYC